MKKRPITFSCTATPFLKIPLTRDMMAIADVEDLELLSQHTWYCDSRGYAVTNIRLPNGKQKRLSMHRLLLNPPEDLQVDHINGDPLDNRRSNLRVCTRAENGCNRKKNDNNTTGFKGVSWNKRDKRFQARIGLSGRRKSLGYYSTPQEAARAYDKAATELHGNFARTNEVLS